MLLVLTVLPVKNSSTLRPSVGLNHPSSEDVKVHTHSAAETASQRSLIVAMDTQPVAGRVIHTLFPHSGQLSLRLDEKTLPGKIKAFADFK